LFFEGFSKPVSSWREDSSGAARGRASFLLLSVSFYSCDLDKHLAI